jgi:hypothetical protein
VNGGEGEVPAKLELGFHKKQVIEINYNKTISIQTPIIGKG